MKRRTGYLVAAIICAIISIPLIMGITGCSKTYLPPEQSMTIEEWEKDMQENPPQSSSLPARTDGQAWTGWNKFWLASAIGGQSADAITTLNAMESSYCREANPLLGGSPGDIAIIGSKVALFGVGLWYTEYYLRDDPRQQKARNAIYATFAVIGAGLGVWNYNQQCN